MVRKLSIAAALSAVAFSANTFAASEIISDSVDSTNLGKKIYMEVYLPDGYEESSETYPVIYMLHGAGSDDSSWVDRGGIKVTAAL